MADAPRDRTDHAEPDNPWDRQSEESPEAWEAFATYRDQGRQRSVRQVGRTLNKSATLIGGWSSTHRWVHRVSAYDRHLDDERRREREGEIMKMERQQASQLAGARQALTQPITAFLTAIAEARDRGENPFEGMKLPDLQRMAVMSIRHLGPVIEAERLVAGLSTENLQADAPATVMEARRRAEQMSRGELEDYLLGVDDGRADVLRELGVPEEELR